MSASMFRRSLALAAAVAFGCSTGPDLAGNSSGGEARTIAGRFVDSTGSGVEDALIVLKEDRDVILSVDPLPSLDSTRTDSVGAFAFTAVEPGGYFLEARLDDRSLVSLVSALASDSGKTLLAPDTMMRPAAIGGAIGFATDFPVFVSLQGTPYATQVGQDGQFGLDGLPPGRYTAVLTVLNDQKLSRRVIAGSSEVTIEAGKSTEMDTMRLTALGPSGSAIVEDFSTCRSQNAFNGGGYWWWVSDEFGTVVSPADKVSDLMMGNPGYGGTGCAARITFTLAASDRPQAGIGTDFFGSLWGVPRSVDLSNVATISFRIKGISPESKVRAMVFSTLEMDSNFVALDITALPADWTQYTIDFSTNEYNKSYPVGHRFNWMNLGRFATRMVIEIYRGQTGVPGELWLDDVMITQR